LGFPRGLKQWAKTPRIGLQRFPSYTHREGTMTGYWHRYWTRIAFGAALVFVLGMAARAAVHRGKAEVSSILATVGSRLPLQLAHMSFRLDGRNLGDVTGVEVRRTSPEDLGRISIRVRPGDAAAVPGADACAISVNDLQRFDDHRGFHCAAQADVSAGDLVEVGDVTFESGGDARPLYVPRDEVARWRHSEIRKLDASLKTDPGGAVHAQGTYDLQDHHGSSEQGSFTLQADSQGAVIAVRDERGRAILDLRAGHDGVNLNVRDHRGRNLMQLIADSLGAALKASK
jgi:hypothetical protein